jgi:hypothetical protein
MCVCVCVCVCCVCVLTKVHRLNVFVCIQTKNTHICMNVSLRMPPSPPENLSRNDTYLNNTFIYM